MAEMTEERKKFVDMMRNLSAENERIEKQKKINKEVSMLKGELGDIADRAYQAAIGKKIGEYQERANNATDAAEREQIQQESAEFEADPSKFGIIRDKCQIIDEADKMRALQIVELLKDTSKLVEEKNMSTDEFVKRMQEYGARNAVKQQ